MVEAGEFTVFGLLFAVEEVSRFEFPISISEEPAGGGEDECRAREPEAGMFS